MAKPKTPRPAPRTRARATTRGRRNSTGGGSTRSTGARATKKATRARPSGRSKARVVSTRRASSARARSGSGKRTSRTNLSARGASTRRKPSTRASSRAKTRRARPAATPTATTKPAKPRVARTRHDRATLRSRLDRERRILEETVPTPPSSLNLDRHPSAARSGREEMKEALSEHNETSPALTGGDVDADWEAAYASGDEAPGGDMPTPDQAVVEDIGAALGVEYQDDEELKGADKIEERDRHRWELDPASAEDYRERARPERRKQ